MCNSKVLHSDAHGYVTQCEVCKEVQLAFGTCLIQVIEEDFVSFCKMISSEVEKFADLPCPSGKAFIYFTDSYRVKLIYSYNELLNLNALITPALLILEAMVLLENGE